MAKKDGKTALHMAAKVDNANAANILIKHGAKVDAPDNQVCFSPLVNINIMFRSHYLLLNC